MVIPLKGSDDVERTIDTDVLVVGAGPSGVTAARMLSESGLKVFVIDSKMEIGAPVVCSDLVNLSFPETQDILSDQKILISSVKSFDVSNTFGMAPSGTDSDAFNIIVERDRLDKELASRAVLSGARINIRSELTSLQEESEHVISVYRRGGKNYGVRSKYVVMSTGSFPGKEQELSLSSHTFYHYIYARRIGKEPPKLAMAWKSGSELNYTVPRKHSEYNSISITERVGRDAEDNSASAGKSPPESIIFGTVSLFIPRTPVLGSDRILRVGSNAGLYDAFFMTGFREAMISGELLASAIKGNIDKPMAVSSDYHKNAKKQLFSGMEKGHKLRTAMKLAEDSDRKKFLEYLSGFSFNEISVEEIFRKASITDALLDEMLPKYH